MRQLLGEIISNEEVASGRFLMWLSAPEAARAARPGQFFMIRTGHTYDPLLRRPFSLHRLDSSASIAFLFSVVGRGTQWLSQLKKGDSLDLLGPLGRGFSPHRSSQNLLLVAGGMGIAPLVALADEAVNKGRSVTLLMGEKRSSLLYPSHLLPPEVEVMMTTEDGSAGGKGLVTDLLAEFINWADEVFACGPTSMYQAMAEMAISRPVQVLVEVPMACGTGACFGCAIETQRGYKLVCQDGPKFDLREISYGLSR